MEGEIEYLKLLKGQLLHNSEVSKKLEKLKIGRDFCHYLEKNNIKYDICIKHPEVLGCNESIKYYKRFDEYLPDDYRICKHLLVKERKGKKRKYLLITDSTKKLDLNLLKDTLECKKLEFVNQEEMFDILHTTPGNVSIFNIINDKSNSVNLVIDKELLFANSLAFHPLYNGMSLFISPKECMKFIDLTGKKANTVVMPEKSEDYHKVIYKKIIAM